MIGRIFAILLCFGLAACSGEPDELTPLAIERSPSGSKIWDQYCANCHGFDGRPVLPEVPNLSFSVTTQPDEDLIDLLRYGRGTMPGFDASLDREEMLAVIDHMRSLPW